MKKLATIAALTVLLLGCGRKVEHGIVTAHAYEPSRTWLMPQTMYCGQGCSQTILIPMTDPEEYLIQVSEQPPCPDNECKTQWMNVGPVIQQQYPIGSRWG